MLRAVLAHLVGFVVDLVVSARRTEDAKDLEIALLRHQLRLLGLPRCDGSSASSVKCDLGKANGTQIGQEPAA